MNELEILLAHNSLSVSIQWLITKIGVAERRPEQNKELIESMQYQVAVLQQAASTFRGLEKEFRVSRQRNCDLEFVSIQYKIKNDELEKDKQDLLKLI